MQSIENMIIDNNKIVHGWMDFFPLFVTRIPSVPTYFHCINWHRGEETGLLSLNDRFRLSKSLFHCVIFWSHLKALWESFPYSIADKIHARHSLDTRSIRFITYSYFDLDEKLARKKNNNQESPKNSNLYNNKCGHSTNKYHNKIWMPDL